MNLRPFFPLLLLLLSVACKSKKEKTTAPAAYKLSQSPTRMANYDEGYPLTDDSIDIAARDKTEEYQKYYKDYYKDKTSPPPFDFNIGLSHKTFNELRLLRAEIMARHGYLFMDYVFRSHFNATKWYQPVFWDNNFKIHLSDEEKTFVAKVLKLEEELYKKNYIDTNGTKRANLENVVNWEQFENIPKELVNHLKTDGFVINKAEHEQLFHAYDENYYDYTPSFITTDLYLQVLHMHISKEMQSIEEEKMIPLVTQLITDQISIAKKTADSTKNPMIKKASEWNEVYYAIGLSLITGTKQEVPAAYTTSYEYEYDHTTEGQGGKSDFLGDSLMDYTQFQPRGNYTRTNALKQYFRCVKWLNSASIYIDNDPGLAKAVLLGDGLLHSDSSLKKYQTFSKIIQFLAGEENNLSIAHLIKGLQEIKYKTVGELLTKENLDKLRSALYAADPRKMFPKGANETTSDFLARKKILFTAGRYTFDGEILQRLVDITGPEPKRPFPKGLDVFAAMGNHQAEAILLNVYNEKQNWAGYPDTLNVLKRKMEGFHNWNQSIYNKKMETVLSLQNPNPDAPYFMQSSNWQKKNLNTMLASWTELKHDMVLYIDQPNGAEMGDGGEVPPPQKIAYVEPQAEFWEHCIALLSLNREILEDNGLLTEKLDDRNNELSGMASLLLRITNKELKKQPVSNEEFDKLSFIGGEVESLTLKIIESGQGSTAAVSTPERYMAVATDVYTYNDKCLQETVGMGDDIYVIAEINGLLYLTRGAVFSHYEFTGPVSQRLTDEIWQKQLLDHTVPAPAIWMNDIKISVPQPKTAPNFNLY
ncbi:MAG TPA: DUF3160 domain-containing protein [Puia sp.]|uniref:DUF3160 domain-containing protein n=1 Tax=Puia sp. TaxID=2045100 RepID=UPI002B607F6D|nr:DUF3160 domain-containing protein [Puia sp.]HVU98734.1 DUF3160 domain-containing protein [Puia sp.]